jgi:S-adenosylmethionine:diacylglycerol 3-amino-3-carboxypropyl transferase
MTLDDWRYSDDKMKVRDQALKILLSKFGHQMEGVLPKYSNQSIYECAHDWVSQGNMHTAGIVKYYEAYYAKSN